MDTFNENLPFAVSSPAVLCLLKGNLQCVRESMSIEISSLSQLMLSLFLFYLEHQRRKKIQFHFTFFCVCDILY